MAEYLQAALSTEEYEEKQHSDGKTNPVETVSAQSMFPDQRLSQKSIENQLEHSSYSQSL